jgi:hypothetical protein
LNVVFRETHQTILDDVIYNAYRKNRPETLAVESHFMTYNDLEGFERDINYFAHTRRKKRRWTCKESGEWNQLLGSL